MQTEKIELDSRFGDEYQGTYLFKEITWAKRSRIIQKYTRYSKLSGEVESSDFIAIQAETIMASLHGQPASHPITLDKLLSEENGIPIGLGELFSQVANRLNNVTGEDARFLSGQSDVKSQTPHSQISDCVKNSGGHPLNSQNSQPGQSSNSLSS